VQEGGGIETSVNPRDVDDVAARKQWGIYYAEAIGPNGKRKEREPEASYFDLLSRFLLEVGDYLGAVAIDLDESWYGEKQCDEKYGDDNENSGGSANGHGYVEI